MVQEDDEPTVILNQVNGLFLSLVIPRRQVKEFKQALEAHGLLDKSLRITPFIRGSDDPVILPTLDVLQINPSCYSAESNEQKYTIPTKFELDGAVRPDDENQIAYSRDIVLKRIGLVDQAGIEAQLIFRRRPSTRFDESNKSPLTKAVREWLHSLPPDIQSKLGANLDGLLNACKWMYTIYPPMLLLPPTFLSKAPWPGLLAIVLKPHLSVLYNIICQQLKVTHIAINGPIPALLPSSESDTSKSNILRSPTNLVPLYGDFGEPNLPSTEQNLRDAFWVSTKQNDITQTWAPLYTMFSRGNISEKTRLLRLVPARSAQESTAVDLYAGVGYFAFSYAKAGVDNVLCWELNGWSIEGLKRGAKTNGWSIKVIDNAREERILDDSKQVATKIGEERFLVFHESNRNAPEKVQRLRHSIPPVSHVNCGYLPSSSSSWDIAVQVLDPMEGGWIHAHENVPLRNIEGRMNEVVGIFRDLVYQYRTQDPASSFNVECQHVEQVKAYAPGIVHCVFDVAILPYSASNGIAQP
ncbi:MAG: hypothetical protein Q9188_007092 [Gyalolechia gomerana]